MTKKSVQTGLSVSLAVAASSSKSRASSPRVTWMLPSLAKAWTIRRRRSTSALVMTPGAPPTHWEQLYFPLLRPSNVAPGHRLSFRLRSKSSRESGTDLAWSATVTDAKGEVVDKQSLNLDKGYLP